MKIDGYIIDYTNILEFLKVGKLYKIYFNKNNINNDIIVIRAIIDNEVVIYKSIKNGNYHMKNLYYFELLLKGKNILIYNKELCIECNEKIATYIRHTQFAGDHCFCTKCAKKQKDFNNKGSDFLWEKKQ